MGLIRGDQAGNFNGSNTMMRAEVATVIMRLKNAEEAQTKAEQEEAERKKQEAEQQKKEQEEAVASNRTGEYITVNFYGKVSRDVPNAPIGLYFKDGRLLGQTVSDEDGKWSMDVTMDKADYSFTEDWYYVAVIGQVKAVIYGKEYTYETDLDYVTPSSIWHNTINFPDGFLANLSPVK